jgi:DNA-binding GntR family transcriptional regulator
MPLFTVPIGTTSVSSLRRQSTTQQASELLRQAILDGVLPLGAPLSEQALSDELGISRTPLREALHALESVGLVESAPYKGARVFSLTDNQLSQLGEFRATLETAALQLALKNDRARLLAGLSGILEKMQQCVETLDTARFGRLDTQLHETIIACSDNEYLIQAHTVVGSRLAVLRNLLRRDAEVIGRSCDDHRVLLDLVGEGRDSQAVEFLGIHIANGTAFFSRSLEQVMTRVTTLRLAPRSGRDVSEPLA